MNLITQSNQDNADDCANQYYQKDQLRTILQDDTRFKALVISYEELKEKYQALKNSKYNIYQEEIETLKRQYIELEQKLKKGKMQKGELKANYNSALKQIALLEDQNKSLTNNLQDANKKIQELNSKLEVKTEKYKFKIATLEKAKQKQEQQNSLKTQQIQTFKKKNTQLQQNIVELKNSLEQIIQKLQIANNEKYQLQHMYQKKNSQQKLQKQRNATITIQFQKLKSNTNMQINLFKMTLQQKEQQKVNLEKIIEQTKQKINLLQNSITSKGNQEHQNSLCIICLDKKATRGIYPCGHITYCETCIVDINRCSLCNTDIQHKFAFWGKS